MYTNFEIEKNEAIAAGERALRSLNEAKQYLHSAGNWGIVDMLGGGFLTTLMKHQKMNNANECLDRARSELQSFNKELHDVNGAMVNLNTSDFLGIADYFFDGFVADFLMQNRISESQQQVDYAINKVQQALDQLRRM